MVRTWLSRSSDEHVRVCQPPASATSAAPAVSYTGESAVRHHGGVCSYASHRLQKIGIHQADSLHLAFTMGGSQMYVEDMHQAMPNTDVRAQHARSSRP